MVHFRVWGDVQYQDTRPQESQSKPKDTALTDKKAIRNFDSSVVESSGVLEKVNNPTITKTDQANSKDLSSTEWFKKGAATGEWEDLQKSIFKEPEHREGDTVDSSGKRTDYVVQSEEPNIYRMSEKHTFKPEELKSLSMIHGGGFLLSDEQASDKDGNVTQEREKGYQAAKVGMVNFDYSDGSLSLSEQDKQQLRDAGINVRTVTEGNSLQVELEFTKPGKFIASSESNDFNIAPENYPVDGDADYKVIEPGEK